MVSKKKLGDYCNSQNRRHQNSNIPAPKTKVINKTFSFSLKTLPKYAGSKKVMQQGAKRATMPATNDAINDI